MRNALGTLAQVSAPAANALPFGGSVVAGAVGAAGDALKQQEPWDAAFKKAVETLKKLNTPVLMIADDIDRLQTSELLALLKVVRLLGRFPGVHYLLAYDEATLYQTLSGANLVGKNDDGEAARFMEKIVQYPLVVPPLLRPQLLFRLDAGIDAAMTEAQRPALTSSRLSQLIDVYLSQLSTPRAIDRYLAQLRHHLPLVAAEEIDDVDVIVLTLLRAAFPTLYIQLPRWRDELVSGHTGEMKRNTGSTIEYEPFSVEDLLARAAVPKSSREDARVLLHDLFPKLSPHGFSSGTPRPPRINDPRFFDRYFAMGIPTHDVANAEVAQAVNSATAGDPVALAALLTQPNVQRVLLVIDKGTDTSEAIPLNDAGDTKRLALIDTLLSVVGQIPDDEDSFFMNPPRHVIAWVATLLTQLTDAIGEPAVTQALNKAPTIDARLEIVRLTERNGDQPSCWKTVTTNLGHDMTARTLNHLRAQDNAAEDEAPRSMIQFLIAHEQITPLAQSIATALAAGEFTLGDVAARLTTQSKILGVSDSRWKLDDFDQATYELLVPHDPHPWYNSPPEDVDISDTSWANRRAFATGRAKQPT